MQMEKTKILLVDDDLDLVLSLKAFLRNQGFDVVTALNKYEGMEQAKTELPNLAILDVMMTYSHEGFDLARDMRKDVSLRHIPIIMFTGIDKATGVSFKSNLGNPDIPADGYIEKPVELHVLLDEIKRVLAGEPQNE
jgi:two-component system, OmpR family, alkaline phosphatase synthesis response regulator PhoP